MSDVEYDSMSSAASTPSDSDFFLPARRSLYGQVASTLTANSPAFFYQRGGHHHRRAGAEPVSIPPSPRRGEMEAELTLESEAQQRAWEMHFLVCKGGIAAPSPAEERSLAAFMTKCADLALGDMGEPVGEQHHDGQEIFSLDW